MGVQTSAKIRPCICALNVYNMQYPDHTVVPHRSAVLLRNDGLLLLAQRDVL